ncbi:fungal-specific transcription factor domain-containing protein [Dactylonectria macrodidyma]|uniref:Fungal-specific transcription factor domain-containing protein n=1 Tax=Dactylonectria macrodidyma TaxID=307937 RepID=A0A9P9DMK4_9HYPO|nr:fungal-specific transcription factor domain-containing protein [Dactylonectria macrodidyma]
MDLGSAVPAPRRRIRDRTSQACNRCRATKIRCDNQAPACSPCRAKKLECIRDPRGQSANSSKRALTLEQRLKEMEASLQVLPTQPGLAKSAAENQSKSSPAGINSMPKTSSDVAIEKSVSSEYNHQHIASANPRVSDLKIPCRDQPTRPTLMDSTEVPVLRLTKDKVVERRNTIRDSVSPKRLYMPMFPKAEVILLAEMFFEEINTPLPLFHVASFMALCQGELPVDGCSENPAWWACLNAVVAMAIQLKTMNDAFRTVSDFSWSLFKNAFAVYPELMENEPTILSVQALLSMAMFLSGTTDTKTMSLLLLSAVEMIRALELHKEFVESDLDPVEGEQRRRIFWVAFLLEKTISIHSGSPSALLDGGFEVNFPAKDPPDGLGNVTISGRTGKVNIFLLRIRLGIIESQVEKCLLCVNASANFDQHLQDGLFELRCQLEAWRESLPLEIQPGYNAGLTPAVEPNSLVLIILHCEFYRCIDMIEMALTLSLSQASRNRGAEGLSGRFSETAARCTIRVLRNVKSPTYTELWRLLPYPLWATITLLSRVLETPGDSRAASDVNLIMFFVQFLHKMQKEGCDLGKFVDGCTVLLWIAKIAVREAQNGLQSQTRSQATNSLPRMSSGSDSGTFIQTFSAMLVASNHLRLAQGLIGNVTNLNIEASAIFSNAFQALVKDTNGLYSLGPESLQPRSYGFSS